MIIIQMIITQSNDITTILNINKYMILEFNNNIIFLKKLWEERNTDEYYNKTYEKIFFVEYIKINIKLKE